MSARSLQRIAPWLWIAPAGMLLIPFFVIPLLLTLRNSFFSDDPMGTLIPKFTLENYSRIVRDPYYFGVFEDTVWAAVLVCLISILMSYPLSWVLARAQGSGRAFLLWIVYLPIYVSIIMRVFGWIVLLSDGGLFNQALAHLGVTAHPLQMMNSFIGMMVGLIQRYLPLMVLPLVTSLRKIDDSILRAAVGLGASRWFVWTRIIFPMSLPGAIVGLQLVFAGVMSDYVIPSLMGSPHFQMLAPAIYYEGITNASWALSGAIASTVILIVALFLICANLLVRRAAPWASL
jgi:ABC-type spermidine/putrescine transport system permease subunit I